MKASSMIPRITSDFILHNFGIFIMLWLSFYLVFYCGKINKSFYRFYSRSMFSFFIPTTTNLNNISYISRISIFNIFFFCVFSDVIQHIIMLSPLMGLVAFTNVMTISVWRTTEMWVFFQRHPSRTSCKQDLGQDPRYR
jgi:hypothetical protein